ncbi:MAG: hypothetical protein ACR2NZ_03175 [Rubripirellula sp.]
MPRRPACPTCSHGPFILTLTLIAGLSVPLATYAQNGGPSKASQRMSGYAAGPKYETEYATETAYRAQDALDASIHLDAIIVDVSELAHYLEEELEEIAVYLDPRTLEIAQVEPSTRIDVVLKPMPLRSALRTILRPHGLQVEVVDEGLAIKPDFTVLTRKGISTDRWLSDSKSVQEIVERLGQSISIEAVEEPLSDLVVALSETSGIPIVIDRRALEEIGLSSDEPVSINLSNISFRAVLRLMLRSLDLTYLIDDEVMQITTIEAAEQNLRGRIYFLEGTGATSEESGDMVKLITSTIVPDTWEQLGGPSTAQPYLPARNKRPAIVVSTTSDIHDRIAEMFNALRESNVD